MDLVLCTIVPGCHIIAIAGLTCSGKTTLARRIADLAEAPLLAFDDYYLPLTEYSLDERKRFNFDAPELFDHVLLAEHLAQLDSGLAVDTPTYSFTEFTRLPETRRIEATPVLVLEGQYALFWPEIYAQCQTRIYLDMDPQVCLARRIARDVADRGRTPDEVRWRFNEHVLPMYERHMKETRGNGSLFVRGEMDLDEVAGKVMEWVLPNRAVLA